MDQDQMQGLTNGNLPLSAFRNLEPTLVGVVDLDRSITPSAPDGRSWTETDHRDGLLLLRLHDQPIAIVHVEAPVATLTTERLAAEIWRAAGSEIQRHIDLFGCIEMPTAPMELSNLVALQACTGRVPAKIDLSIAVIVPTLGREDQLRRCVRSLLALRYTKFEVIVVDNRPAAGDTSGIVKELASGDARVRYVAEWRAGSSTARNRGVSETDAEIVVFTDDDVVVDPSWLGWLIAPFAEPRVTVTCGMVLPLELQTKAQKRFEQYGGFSKGIEPHSYELSNDHKDLLLYPFLGDIFGSGNSMAFRRADFVAAGGFDPALGGGTPAQSGEDLYAFSTAILGGDRLVYEPRALCWHEHRRDEEALHRQVFDYGIGLGAMMTKATLSGDPRFMRSVARSLPLVFGLLREKIFSTGDSVDSVAAPAALQRAQFKGMLRGPLRYVQGVVRARRLKLADVIRGI